jgi:hypothetical protein
MSATDLKRRHERAVADELLKTLKFEAVFVRLGNDIGEPDVIYEGKARTLGIEVATAYHDKSDARQAWEHHAAIGRCHRKATSSGMEEF